jgi:hypothetical protein
VAAFPGDTNAASAVPVKFPQEYYFEEVIKTSNLTPCSGYCLMYDASSFAFPGSGIACSVSADFDEVSSGSATVNTGLAGYNFSNSCTTGGYEFGPGVPTQSPAPSTSAYTTYGNLVTIDGQSTVAQCNYSRSGAVGGLQAQDYHSCVTWQVVPSATQPPIFNNEMYLYVGGPAFFSGSWDMTASSFSTYVQRITMWRCPSPNGNGQCYNNPVITTAP